MRIGEIAKACKVSVDTIRHYEQQGVIPQSTREDNGYRRFPDNTIDRVLLVRRALAIGFTLAELSRIFKQRASGQAPCREVQSLAKRKLVDIDDRIREMKDVRDALASIIDAWTTTLDHTPPGEMAHLLESLIDHERRTN